MNQESEEQKNEKTPPRKLSGEFFEPPTFTKSPYEINNS